MYGRIIKRSLKSNEAMGVLLNAINAGPCDGGCLIVARAIVEAIGRGSLVRLVSGAVTQHYGALVDGIVYDGLGAHSPRTWAKKFAKAESCPVFDYRDGFTDELDSGIPDLPDVTKQLTSILSRALEGARL